MVRNGYRFAVYWYFRPGAEWRQAPCGEAGYGRAAAVSRRRQGDRHGGDKGAEVFWLLTGGERKTAPLDPLAFFQFAPLLSIGHSAARDGDPSDGRFV